MAVLCPQLIAQTYRLVQRKFFNVRQLVFCLAAAGVLTRPTDRGRTMAKDNVGSDRGGFHTSPWDELGASWAGLSKPLRAMETVSFMASSSSGVGTRNAAGCFANFVRSEVAADFVGAANHSGV
jgi:hypothetical protein